MLLLLYIRSLRTWEITMRILHRKSTFASTGPVTACMDRDQNNGDQQRQAGTRRQQIGKTYSQNTRQQQAFDIKTRLTATEPPGGGGAVAESLTRAREVDSSNAPYTPSPYTSPPAVRSNLPAMVWCECANGLA
jgi:hypothetical protein